MRRFAYLSSLLILGCEGPPSAGPGDLGGAADAAVVDAATAVDAEPVPPPPLDFFGPSLVMDDVHIASFTEEPNALQLLGFVLNDQLQQQIADGTLLLGMSLIELDDPSGQADDQLSVASFMLVDSDDDPTDNFDPAEPEQFTIAQGGTLGELPTIHFTEATLEDGALFGSRVGIVVLLETLFAISDAEIEGTLVPSEDGSYIAEIRDGRVRGALSGGPLALIPNPMADSCPGGTLLDVFVTGCGLLSFPLQPDTDIDGDGIERYYDTDGDGTIDRCVDGDQTEILGTSCATDLRMADGYSFAWVFHGVRAHIDQTVPAPPDEL